MKAKRIIRIMISLFPVNVLFIISCSTPTTHPIPDSAFSVKPLPDSFSAAQAQDEASRLGFDSVKRQTFFEDWRQNRRSAISSRWRPMVEACSSSQNPIVRYWGMGKLIEAGEFRHLDTYLQESAEYLFAQKKHGGRLTDVIGGFGDAPGAWQMMPDSLFWPMFESRIKSEEQAQKLWGLYAIWSLNHHKQQQALVLAIASSIGQSGPPSWDDPRFLMVADWLCVHGASAEWDSVISLWAPGTPASEELKKFRSRLATEPLFQAPLRDDRPADWWTMRVVPKTKGQMEPAWFAAATERGVKGHFAFSISIGSDGSVRSCRPLVQPWAAFVALGGIRYYSGRSYTYQNIPPGKWPGHFLYVENIKL